MVVKIGKQCPILDSLSIRYFEMNKICLLFYREPPRNSALLIVSVVRVYLNLLVCARRRVTGCQRYKGLFECSSLCWAARHRLSAMRLSSSVLSLLKSSFLLNGPRMEVYIYFLYLYVFAHITLHCMLCTGIYK